MEINSYKVVLKNERIHIEIDKNFFKEVKYEISQNYGSLINYNKHNLMESAQYARQIFCSNKYIRPHHILKMIKDSNISKRELFKNIIGFRIKGSKRLQTTQIQQKLKIDENFVEGYGLYLAEGDNGANGHTIPKKLRLVNSDLNVIKTFMNWIDKYFPNNEYYVVYLLPNRIKMDYEHIEQVKKYLKIKTIKIQKWNAKRKSDICYRVCLDSAILIYLFLEIKKQVKEFVKKDSNLMKAYIRGMMIGEGTAHHKGNFHYVRIEMKNEEEILFLASLFKKLGFKFTCKERGTRKGMWYIYIGGKKNLINYHKEIGFGVLEKRERILKEIVRWYELRI